MTAMHKATDNADSLLGKGLKLTCNKARQASITRVEMVVGNEWGAGSTEGLTPVKNDLLSPASAPRGGWVAKYTHRTELQKASTVVVRVAAQRWWSRRS